MSMQTRLFVGGLPGDVDAELLRKSFGEFGKVVVCDLKSKPSDPDSQFAFITIDAGQLDVEACIRHFSQSAWHGAQLHVTRARESFLERLQKERAQSHAKKPAPVRQLIHTLVDDNNYDPAGLHAPSNSEENFKIRTPQLSNLKIRNPSEVISNGFHDKRSEKSLNKVDTYSKNDKIEKTSYRENYKKVDTYSNNDKIERTSYRENYNKDDTYSKNDEIERTSYSENYKKGSDNFTKKEKFTDDKKITSDNKRLDSMRKMRKEFNEKKLLIKSGLAGVDKASNKKIKFDDDDEPIAEETRDVPGSLKIHNGRSGKSLFDDGDDDGEDDVDFQIKEQFEGKRGQKVLELQSRFKSDKRFTLDKRFIDDEDDGIAMEEDGKDDQIEVLEVDEKSKQLNILQNVLGHAIRSSHTQPEPVGDKRKTKAKMGMLRFDPNHPDHAKFLAPSDSLKKDVDGSNKMKRTKRKEEAAIEPQHNVEKVEVSKEQFYKISESLKEAIAQPNTFSLRSLFSKDQLQDEENKEQDSGYTTLTASKKDKVRNPLDKGDKNPFKYDSSDSEPELDDKKADPKTQTASQIEEGKPKAVWREKLFFSRFDSRFKEGLAFFNNMEVGASKERRELKVLMKKRLNNRSRKDTMFQKKIGGKRKNFNKNRNSRKQNR